MSLTIGSPSSDQAPPSPPPQTAAGPAVSPSAFRRRRHRLRDPRVWVGVLLLVLSALIGGRIVSSADDTSPVWVAAHDLAAGQRLTPTDLVASRVQFASPTQRDSYLSADGPVPADLTLEHAVGQGELIAVAAVGGDRPLSPQLPIGLDGADAPADLAPGQQVAIWAVPTDPGRSNGARDAHLVLPEVKVLEVTGGGGFSGQLRVLVEVRTDDDVRAALSALAGARPVLVRVGR